MSQQVESILHQISELSHEEFLELEHRLQERNEVEWQAEVVEARVAALRQGIDQQKIDEAIADLRYGS